MGLSKEERRLRIRRRIRKTVSELLMHLASLSLEVTRDLQIIDDTTGTTLAAAYHATKA